MRAKQPRLPADEKNLRQRVFFLDSAWSGPARASQLDALVDKIAEGHTTSAPLFNR